MKLLFISNSIIPDRKANSVQVMRMCEAFAKNGCEVYLLVGHESGDLDENISDIFKYYDIEEPFKILKIPRKRIINNKIIRKLFQKLLNFILMAKTILKISPDFVYGRNIYGCLVSAQLGYKTIYEAHGKAWEKKNKLSIFKRLIKKSKFIQLVVISKALKDMYVSGGHISENEVHIAHSGTSEKNKVGCLPGWPGRGGVCQVGYVGHLYKGKGIEVIEK